METIRTPEKAAAFIAALAEHCNVGKACTAAGISRSSVYAWREDDPLFGEAWNRAMRVGLTALEDEVHRRAFEGVDKPVFHQGAQCGSMREYSDTLAIFLLKAHDPEKYRERQDLNIRGSVDIAATILEARKRAGGA